MQKWVHMFSWTSLSSRSLLYIRSARRSPARAHDSISKRSVSPFAAARNSISPAYRLVRAAQRGEALPSPAVRPDGITLAPAGIRPHPAERLAVGLLHPGA